MKIFLCAYRRVGRAVLEYLLSNYNKEDIAVFTHDKDDSVSYLCQKYNIWFTYENINNVTNFPFVPDVISSVYYAYIFKDHIINLCNHNIFNVHPSLLPNHRGCSAVPWSIIDGDKITGITYHYIDSGIDTGNIIFQISAQINDDETQLSLYNRLMDLAIESWPAALTLVESGYSGTVTKDSFTQYHKREVPFNGEIDLSWSKDKIERFIRAMYFPPLKPATYKGKFIYSLDDLKNWHS